MSSPSPHSSNEQQEPESSAHGELGTALYAQLKQLARAQMAREPRAHTLQATALVHEAWLRLGKSREREHESFLALAAGVMRRVLVDHARKSRSLKRGAAYSRVPMELAESMACATPVDLLEIDRALQELEALDERAFRIVELRFFGGMEMAQIATLLGMGERSVKREWATARLWLLDRMQRPEEQDG